MSRDKQKIVRVPEKSRVKRDRIAPKTKVFEQRDKLIAEYYEYVDVVVLRLMREMHLPPQMKEEFVSAGLFGLIEAAGRFKPERGQQFKTFSFLRIRGAVIDYIRQSCDLSGYAYRRLKSLEAAQQLREDRLEEKEAASARDVDTFEQSVGCLEKTAIIFRLTRQAGSEDASATDQESQNPERSLENRRTAKKIREIVATLPEKERIIVEQYYFHDRKLVDVAEQFAGLSKSWVSRLHDRAIEMLREKIAATVPELAA